MFRSSSEHTNSFTLAKIVTRAESSCFTLDSLSISSHFHIVLAYTKLMSIQYILKCVCKNLIFVSDILRTNNLHSKVQSVPLFVVIHCQSSTPYVENRMFIF